MKKSDSRYPYVKRKLTDFDSGPRYPYVKRKLKDFDSGPRYPYVKRKLKDFDSGPHYPYEAFWFPLGGREQGWKKRLDTFYTTFVS